MTVPSKEEIAELRDDLIEEAIHVEGLGFERRGDLLRHAEHVLGALQRELEWKPIGDYDLEGALPVNLCAHAHYRDGDRESRELIQMAFWRGGVWYDNGGNPIEYEETEADGNFRKRWITHFKLVGQLPPPPEGKEP